MATRRPPRTATEQVNHLEEQLRRLLATLSATPSDMRLLFDSRGDILVAVEADLPQRLALGADDDVLTVDRSTQLGVAWRAINALRASLLTSKGDLIVGDDNGEPAALPVGPDGTVATADSGAPLGIAWLPSAESDAEVLAWLTMAMVS